MLERIVKPVSRLMRLWRHRGTWPTLQFICTRLFRYEVHWVYAIDTRPARPAVKWGSTETLQVVDRDNLDAELNPTLEAFLGGPTAFENLCGIRDGDLLFVITDEQGYVHRGYALFRTRQKELLGEEKETPMLAYCYTHAAARGRGLYRRALAAEIEYLQAMGCRRVAIETDPSNIASQKGILAAGFDFSREVRAWIVLNSLVLSVTKDGSGRSFRLMTL